MSEKDGTKRGSRRTDLDEDAEKGENDKLGDEEEGGVTSGDDPVGLRVCRSTLQRGDPAIQRGCQRRIGWKGEEAETNRIMIGRIICRRSVRRGGTIPTNAEKRVG